MLEAHFDIYDFTSKTAKTSNFFAVCLSLCNSDLLWKCGKKEAFAKGNPQGKKVFWSDERSLTFWRTLRSIVQQKTNMCSFCMNTPLPSPKENMVVEESWFEKGLSSSETEELIR